ncbi:MAG: DNA repair protein RecN, partial [Bacteroidota bacterium]
DPARIQELQERLDLIYKLQKKHQVASVAELLQIQEDFSQQLRGFTHQDEEINRLRTAVTEAETQLREQAAQLRQHRERVAPGFAKKVGKTLAGLAMPAAQLVVDMQPQEQPGPTGMDEVQFLFSANKGSTPKPIKNVASGGELSRLTLVTKSLVADAMALPTLIFDEIDAGVSGDVALKMGQILQQLSSHHQVVVITHSPQVAAHANEHFFVYKKEAADRTMTKIRALQPDERVRALAVMLSQNPPSESALENARELIAGV